MNGRDLYDYVFYLDKGIPYNKEYLSNKLGHEEELNHPQVVDLLNSRFDDIDYRSAIKDVLNFIPMEKVGSVELWCPKMFRQITEGLRPENYQR